MSAGPEMSVTFHVRAMNAGLRSLMNNNVAHYTVSRRGGREKRCSKSSLALEGSVRCEHAPTLLLLTAANKLPRRPRPRRRLQPRHCHPAALPRSCELFHRSLGAAQLRVDTPVANHRRLSTLCRAKRLRALISQLENG